MTVIWSPSTPGHTTAIPPPLTSVCVVRILRIKLDGRAPATRTATTSVDPRPRRARSSPPFPPPAAGPLLYIGTKSDATDMSNPPMPSCNGSAPSRGCQPPVQPLAVDHVNRQPPSWSRLRFEKDIAGGGP
uniref:Uncharacterized protein n=1 Tax=Eutreptiella gymnastica TaxID=73025 RepID=A0A7S4D2M6_9EUGL